MARKFSLEKKFPIFPESTETKNYVNINNYANVKIKKKNSPILKKSSIHSFHSLKSSSFDDDNVWNYEEIVNPEVNYYDLDLRKNKYKSKNKPFPTVKLPKIKNSGIFNYTKMYILKKRSLNSDPFDFTNKHQAIIYADLILHHCGSADKLKEAPKRLFLLNNNNINYIEIDFQKTHALEETDKAFKKSKLNTYENSTMHSFISLCRKLSNKIKKPTKKN